MQIHKHFWDQFDKLPVPGADEVAAFLPLDGDAAGWTEPDGLPTEQYIRMQTLYRALFSGLLAAKIDLQALDRRLLDAGFLPSSPLEMDFYQSVDLTGLRCIYLRSGIHIERLTKAQADILSACLAERDNGETFEKALEVVEETYPAVLAVSPEAPQQEFALFPSIHNEGAVHGSDIVFMLCTRPAYDAQGMLADVQADDRRIRVCQSVSAQLKPLLCEALGVPVSVMTEV